MRKQRPKVLRVTLSSWSEICEDIRKRDKLLRQGLPLPPEDLELSLSTLSSFLSTFTPKRTELITTLRSVGHVSIRQLAKSLCRDFKNVHTDIQHLKRLDVVKEDKNRKVYVPWDIIDFDLRVDFSRDSIKAA